MKTALRIMSVVALVVIGSLASCPLAGQTPVTGPQFKATLKVSVCDSIPRIGANGANARLRDRLATRCTGMLAVPLKVDTVTVFVPVVDTVYLPLPPDTLTPPVGDTVIPIPPDPPTGEQFTDTLSGVRLGDVVCADGRACLVRDLEIRNGSLRTVSGVLAFRDGSRLKLTGCDPNAYVGGGMYWTPELAGDCGVWVGGPNATGRLDAACTPVTPLGPASDWKTTDELWTAPTAVGDFVPRRLALGSPVPRASPLVPTAEIVNVTRGCSIEGTGHVHIHSQAPQRIEYLALVGLGVSNVASKGSVLGRYALHLHMMGDGSRGTSIRGVTCVDCRGKFFVPHSSHGVTAIDLVAVNLWGEGLWWDPGHATNDLLIDRMIALGVRLPDSIGGGPSSVPAFHLGGGTNMEIRNSVAAGVAGTYQTPGFDWPEPTTPFQPVVDKLVWTFNRGNVAHNNAGPGVRFWTNNQDLHDVSNFTTYRNKIAGVENGAYFSATQYHGITSFEDGFQGASGVNDAAGFFNNASATVNSLGVMQLTDCNITSLDGPAMKVGHRQLPATHRFLVQDCTFTSNGNPGLIGVPLAKWPKVWVHLGDNPWLAHFVRTNVLPEDIVFENVPGNNGSVIDIDHADGRKWRVQFLDGQKVVTVR